ncbi:MAG: hypothetical protein A2X64_07415 [Ignavibacteria bacterium GWF2_33_9]|nr:MAG: hypothetical protein A2X64_07415 [Ignavibacteria bacterium GWF2_33_9]
MKNSIVLGTILISIISVNLFAQDLINPPKFDYLIQNNIPTCYWDYIYHGNSPYILGWNWSSKGAALDNALQMNTYHDFPFTQTDVKHNLLLIQPPNEDPTYKIVSGHNQNYILNAHCLHLEPTITVDSTENFKPRFGDITGAVFAWTYKTVGDTVSSGDDFSRFILHNNSVSSPTLVLKDIWKGNILKWLDYCGNDIGITNDITLGIHESENSEIDIDSFHPFNGKQWYCSINLRALNSEDIYNHLNDTILVIKIPYVFTHYNDSTLKEVSSTTNDYVKFDSLPNYETTLTHAINSTVNNDFRGYAKALEERSANIIAITGKMLIVSSGSDITISAFAGFTGDTLWDGSFQNNPRLKNVWHENRYQYKDYITSFDVEVTYYGNLDIAIDWIRLETPRCQRVLRGYYDLTIKNAVENLLEKVKTDNIGTNPTYPKLYRFYADDEMIPSMWLANRYYNMLVDTLAGLETYVHNNMPSHYLHATGFKEYWNGDVLRFDVENFNPFIKTGQNAPVLPSFFHYKGGYAGNNVVGFNNILDSPYETYLANNNKSMPINDYNIFDYPDNDYTNYVYRHGLLFSIEDKIFHNFYQNPSLIFNDKPWWANLWVQSENWFNAIWKIYDPIIQDSIECESFTLDGARPRTGEENRLMINTAINLGAKGLIYWFKTSNAKFWNGSGELGLQPQNLTTSLTGDELLYSEDLGGDYVLGNDNQNVSDPNGFDDHFNNSSYDFSTMDIDKDNIFIGLKSARTEINKIHKWIKANENTLMNLKLQAWYGKGFLELYKQNPSSIYSNLMNFYIDINNIKTRPLNRVENGNPLYEQHTTIDSGFYDVTLYSYPCEQNSINYEYKLNGKPLFGIINRRTDPLIQSFNYGFISTSTFDYMVNYGNECINDNPFPEWFRQCNIDFWWQRLGAREIVLPIYCSYKTVPSAKNPVKWKDNEPSIGLRIDELGCKMPDWFMQEPYNNLISNYYPFINQRDTLHLRMKLLPGQGKIMILKYIFKTVDVPKEILISPSPISQQKPTYLTTILEYTGTNCDSLISTNPMFASGIATTLDSMVWDYSTISDYTKPPIDTTLHPCTEEDLQLMNQSAAKYVARHEMRDSVMKTIVYLVFNGICYCDNADNGILYQLRGYVNQNYNSSTPCDTNQKSI